MPRQPGRIISTAPPINSPQSVAAEPPELVIEAGRAERHYWADLWQFRELFYFLAWRDVIVRYKQTAIGIVWALIQPLMTLIIFTFVFGRLAKLPSGGAPYAVLVCAGVLPWQFFSTSLVNCSQSLTRNANLLTKVYFPRLLVPSSSCVVSLVDFLISCVLLAAICVWYGFVPPWRIIAIPLFLGLAWGAALGAGLWFAALNVRFRDFHFVVPLVVQLGLFVSPVGFSSTVAPDRIRAIYAFNPMVGVIDGFRWCIIGSGTGLTYYEVVVSTGMVVILMLSGVWYFRRTERSFADVI